MPLRMFGAPTDHAPLEWAWVEEQLSGSDTYWVTPTATPWPHPRPVWGIWAGERLCLSLGSPVIRAALAADPRCTIHLPSGTDVVIVEGEAAAPVSASELIAAYDAKYDWEYALDDYGPFTAIAPLTVSAWRAVGPAGRDGFGQSGRWSFEPELG